MSKLITFILFFTLILIILPQKIFATGLTVSPPQLTIADTAGITVNASGLLTDKNYSFAIQNNNSSPQLLKLDARQSYSPDASGSLSFLICPIGNGTTFDFAINCSANFHAGTYTVLVFEGSSIDSPDKAFAKTSFGVNTKIFSQFQYENSNFTTSDEIIIKVDGLGEGSYKVQVDGKDSRAGGACKDSSGGTLEYDVGKYPEGGPYHIAVYKNNGGAPGVCGAGDLVAQGQFSISNNPNSPGGGTSTDANTEIAPSACTPGQENCTTAAGEKCNPNNPGGQPLKPGTPEFDSATGIQTAIGCVPTEPTAFVKGFLKFAIGIGGGLAFLLMIIGAFQMITSAGNAENLNTGRERFTSAIIGLLFIILSVLLLKIIGVDILNLGAFLGY